MFINRTIDLKSSTVINEYEILASYINEIEQVIKQYRKQIETNCNKTKHSTYISYV